MDIKLFQELEKKFSQTGAYKNLKKMLSAKNDQIKTLRKQVKALGGGGEGGSLEGPSDDDEEEEEE